MKLRWHTHAPLDLFWVVPDRLAGMSIPDIHKQRYERPEAELTAYEDDLPLMRQAGVDTVVCLLNTPRVVPMYQRAGFRALVSPIPDGGIPSLAQYREIMDYIRVELAAERSVVVHCIGGLGRTGTILAGYLIEEEGMSAFEAIHRVRRVRPGAIETRVQENFLQALQKG